MSSSGSAQAPDLTHDAVVVVPGIMGSRLVEHATGTVLWDLHPDIFAGAWLAGDLLDRLRLTDAERGGRYGRIRATELIRTPAWLPFLRGIEPYTRLAAAVRKELADPAALLTFPYDWRLPVAHNAVLLAEAAMRHLTSWRTTAAHEAARRQHPTGRPARLVIVAHSMGGLLARRLALIPGVTQEIRAVVTLGTPFHGSIKAVAMLSGARWGGPPLPNQRVTELVRTLPGIYDLLPWYRCVDEQDSTRWLDRSDVDGLGGDPDLLDAASAAHRQDREAVLPGHRLVIGAAQRTAQSLRIRYGVAEPLDHECDVRDGTLRRVNRFGDGTVPRGSAELPGSAPVYWAQQHGALARTDESIRHVREVVRERDPDLLGPPLSADGGIGLDVPEIAVAAGQQWTAAVTGVPHTRAATCSILDGATGRQLDLGTLAERDGSLVALIRLPKPGLYRITLDAGGSSAVSQLVFAE